MLTLTRVQKLVLDEIGARMNLLIDPCWPVTLSNGVVKKVAFIDLFDDQIIDFKMPRQDLYGAAYEFALGIIQACYTPTDSLAWFSIWKTGINKNDFYKQIVQLSPAFEIGIKNTTTPRFMQELGGLHRTNKRSPIASLLVESPGENTIKNNTDLFVKRNKVNSLSPFIAAMALYALQTYAPSGGQGHRTGLRGGGPITTLISLNGDQDSLWKQLWLNVLVEDEDDFKIFNNYLETKPQLLSPLSFPWMGKTKVSKNEDNEIYQNDIHPIAMYWAMPRRIELIFEENINQERCSLTNETSDVLVKEFKTENYGNNYFGEWWHPLTPYRKNPKKPGEPNFSQKGKPGKMNFHNWFVVSLLDQEKGYFPAKTIASFYKYKSEFLEQSTISPRLCAYGFDFDNMKARSWHYMKFPMFNLNETEISNLLTDVKVILELIESIEYWLDRALKEAINAEKLQGSLADVKINFISKCEPHFYDLIGNVIKYKIKATESEDKLIPIGRLFLDKIKSFALNQFDSSFLSSDTFTSQLERIVKCRTHLEKMIQFKCSKNYRNNFLKEIQVIETKATKKGS